MPLCHAHSCVQEARYQPLLLPSKCRTRGGSGRLCQTTKRPATPASPGLTCGLGQGRAHLGTATCLLGNAAIPRRGIPRGKPGRRHDYSLAGRDAACERRPQQRARRGLEATAGARPWDTSAEPPSPSSWRGGVGPCHGVAVGQLWPPRSVRTCCPLVAPREDGSRARHPATARSVAVTPQPLRRDPRGLILRGAPRLGKTSPATRMRNIPECQHTMISRTGWFVTPFLPSRCQECPTLPATCLPLPPRQSPSANPLSLLML